MRDEELVVVLFGLAGLCTFAAVIVWRRRRAVTPAEHPGESGRTARVIASDTGVMPPVLLRDPVLGLRGKPDYLIRTGPAGAERVSPLEVKPTRRARRVYESDELQAAAYLILARAHFGAAASDLGYVQYAGRRFGVRLTPVLEDEIRHLVGAVRQGRKVGVLHRSHANAARCRACPLRGACDEAL